MSDLQDIRSRLREEVRRRPASDGGGKNYTLVFAGCGLVIGFALFMFVPRFFQTSGTATIRDIGAAPPGVETGKATDGTRYAGKGADEIGRIADEVCLLRAPPRVAGAKAPRLSAEKLPDFVNADTMKQVNDQVSCLLTEGPARYCAPGQQRMIVGELTLYFRGVEQANRLANVLRQADPRKANTPETAPDPRVLAGLEARLRDGHLTTANRDAISSEAPRWVRDRLVKIEPRKSLCPEKPWWAVWR